jgi:hypothetical protein
MAQKPWRQAQTLARQLAAKVEPELSELRGKFDRRQLGASDYASRVAAAVLACEALVEQALVRNQPPLTPGMSQARVDHQQTRVACREVIREAVGEFM